MYSVSIVPIPKAQFGRPAKYPWKELGIGESFFVAGVTVTQFSGQVHTQARRRGAKYACRTVIEEGVSGVRIWRVT